MLQVGWPFALLGTPELVTSQAGMAAKDLMKGFARLRLPVSKKKTVVLASSSGVFKKLVKQWRPAADARRNHARNLGTDATDGIRRRVPISRLRLRLAAKRGKRNQLLRKAGAEIQHVHRAGATALSTWGAAVSGIPPTQLHGLRVSAAAAHARLPKGACVGLRLHPAIVISSVR